MYSVLEYIPTNLNAATTTSATTSTASSAQASNTTNQSALLYEPFLCACYLLWFAHREDQMKCQSKTITTQQKKTQT